MNLMVHLPRFLCICNYFCFAGIVVEKTCTPPIVEEMFVFLLYECVPLLVFGLHEYRPIFRLEAFAVKAMRPILTREFSFQ